MLKYHNIPVLASEASVQEMDGISIRIGAPEIVAARDESPDEGTFVAPKLRRFGNSVFLNWSFDWDVCDASQPAFPNGRVSHDGGLTWQRQSILLPSPASIFQTGERELAAWCGQAFEVPGVPGLYKVPKWRSPDLGATWLRDEPATVRYPGTKGIDIYHPPEEFRKRDANHRRGGVKEEGPAYLEEYFREFSRFRPLINSALDPQMAGPDGTLYSMVYGRYLHDVEGIVNWDEEYWRRLNWSRYAVLMQVSRDHGQTWEFGGVPVNGSDYQPRVNLHLSETGKGAPVVELLPEDRILPGYKGRVDFLPGDGFSEPSLVVFPDGEMLCALRTGGHKPLYGIRSLDGGRSWTKAELLSSQHMLPICGVLPKLVLLKNGILALCTGRPDCTVHFSRDRGHTWFFSETLFSVVGAKWEGVYSGSHCNNSMIAVDENTLLYVHDATRLDPSATHAWLRKAGHALIIGRRIEVKVEQA